MFLVYIEIINAEEEKKFLYELEFTQLIQWGRLYTEGFSVVDFKVTEEYRERASFHQIC